MKVAGFTIIRNAIKFDFPIVEAIQSILPICDKVFVAVGDSDDETRKLIESIDATKIVIFDTVWDKKLTVGGMVLADETNKVFQQIPSEYDWCFYIQGDEVFHEDGLATAKEAMTTYKNDYNIDGLLVNYLHFYGSYDYVATSSNWYKKEIRIIRNNKKIYSYKDAQGFRKNKDEKLNVKFVNAFMHHYGWVKEPTVMMDKLFNTGTIWQSINLEEAREQNKHLVSFDYSEIDALSLYSKSHPKVMLKRIYSKNWKFDYDVTYNKLSFKNRFKQFCQKLFKIDDLFEYKNYRKV